MKKEKYECLKDKNNISMCILFGKYNNDTDCYVMNYDIVNKNGKELYEFGKYTEWNDNIRKKYGKNVIFEYDESDCEFWQIDKLAFLEIIKWYIEEVKEQYKLNLDNEDVKDNYNSKQKWFSNDLVYNLNCDVEELNQCWFFEYAIFDMLRIYKSLKDDDVLFIYGH